MALVKKLNDFPGFKTFEKIYDSIPGSPLVKNIIAGALAVGAAVAVGLAVATVGSGVIAGVIGLSGAFTAFLGAGLLAQVGVLLALGALWAGIKTAVGFAYTFDWNISDKAIEERIKESQEALYRPVGQAAGKIIGWVGCGFAPAAFTFAFSPAAFTLITKNLKESMVEEMKQEAANLANLTLQSQANVKLLKTYGSIRKWIKRPDSPLHNLIKDTMGQENFEKWGVQDGEPFVITKQIDKQIDKVDDKKTKTLLEGFKEGLEEGCQEASMVVSNSISEQMAAYKLAADARASGVIEASI